LYAHGPKFFCFVYDHGHWNAQEVKAGPTNDKFFVIESGLKEGDQIAMNPRAYLANVSLPKLPPEEIQRAVPQSPSARTADGATKSSSEKVASRPNAVGAQPAAEAQPGPAGKGPGGREGSGEGRKRRQANGGQPGDGSPTKGDSPTKASTAAARSATPGATQ
jgi:hypothetical protein